MFVWSLGAQVQIEELKKECRRFMWGTLQDGFWESSKLILEGKGGLVLKDRGEVSPAGGETLLRKIKIGGGRNQKWGVSFKRATKVSREVKRAGRQEAGKVPRLSAQTEENKSK